MPAKNDDLHGSVPENSSVVLIMVDVINDLEFDGGDDLLQNAIPMAKRLAALGQRARDAGIPVIYVNDNFGKWRSDFRALLDHCRSGKVRGSVIADTLTPASQDYFVLKPKHSGFFSTTLDTLLEYLHARAVILTGLTTDRCVLFTAADAHMRDLHLYVPSDCCAAESMEQHDQAVELMSRVLDACVEPSPDLELAAIVKKYASTPKQE